MMPPVSSHIVTQLRYLIYYNLDCNLLQNALFLAGRLLASEPKSPEAAYLQALCHIRLGQYRAAYESSKQVGLKGTHLGCSYAFAQSCLELGWHQEGITALDRSSGLWRARNNWNKHTDIRRQHLPDASAIYCLVGKLCQNQKDITRAIDSYAEALKLNPFMWDAFLGLCNLGVNVRIPHIFKMTPEMMSALATGSTEETPLGILRDSPPNESLNHVSQSSFGIDPFSVSANRANIDNRSNLSKSTIYEKLNSSTSTITPILSGGLDFEGPDTPAFPGVIRAELQIKDPTLKVSEESIAAEPPQAPMRKARALYGGLGMEFGIDAPPKIKAGSWRLKSKTHGDLEDVDHSNAHSNNGISERKRTISGHVTQAAPTGPVSQSGTNLHDPMAPQRRSARLFNQIRPQSGKLSSSTTSMGGKDAKELKKAKATGTKGRGIAGSTVGRVVSGNRKHGDLMEIDGKEPRIASVSHPKPAAANDKAKELEALQWLLDLFVKLGSGYFALSHYRCEDAIQVFNTIVPSQKDTPWVLAQIGRAMFEQNMYSEAEKCFARIKVLAPARLEDMELYSTALWHLRRDVDLAHLALEISDVNRLSPHAWCAIGNSFSLRREHEQALKCFKRATQLDPKFAYAFTLQGHEHQSNEEFEKALTSYRSAIAVENRHYQGWYGLAQVYEKQGKFEDAEQHYRSAASINPTSAVLITCIGTVLEKMNNLKGALTQYTLAVDLAPKVPFVRFKKARILMSLQEPHLALADLEILKNIAPDEANVHFWLGKCYKVLRQKGKSIKHLTIAMNLNPKVRAATFLSETH